MSIIERIKRLFGGEDRTVDTESHRIDTMTAGRSGEIYSQSEGGSIPPNYLPTGVDEGRPKK
jgi:hypothetical protein